MEQDDNKTVAGIEGTGSFLTITENRGCPVVSLEIEKDCCEASFAFVPSDVPVFIERMRIALDEIERQWLWCQEPYTVPKLK